VGTHGKITNVTLTRGGKTEGPGGHIDSGIVDEADMNFTEQIERRFRR
jgi:hypothetical protein